MTTSTPLVPTGARSPRGGAWLAAAFAASAGIVVGAQLWFRALQRVWPTDDPPVEGLQQRTTVDDDVRDDGGERGCGVAEPHWMVAQLRQLLDPARRQPGPGTSYRLSAA